jgi:outer membrane protein OmpA-like peptidoglycan-associated protein
MCAERAHAAPAGKAAARARPAAAAAAPMPASVGRDLARPGLRACACGGGCPRCRGAPPAEALAGLSLHPDSPHARKLGAAAFAQGSQIHVAPGFWAPHTRAGRELIGHEIVLVLQQRSGRVAANAQAAGRGLNDDPALEAEADALAPQAWRAFAAWLPHAAAVRPAGPPAAAAHGVVQRRSSPLPQTCAPPAVMDCTPGQDDPPRVNREFRFGRDSAVLDAVDLGFLDRVAAAWHRGGAATVLRIDGYASAEGDCSYNWALSCRRAAAVRAALEAPSDRSPGVPPAGLQALAHGESDAAGDALAANRRATLVVPLPATRGADQRVSPGGHVAAEPDSHLAREIGFELAPASRPPPVAPRPPPPPGGPAPGGPAPPLQPPPAPVPWDGRAGSPTEAASRAAMQRELFAGYDAYLTFKLPITTARLALPRVPFATPANPGGAAPRPTGVIDIANQARDVLEARYAVSMDVAATSPAQLAHRGPLRGSGAGQNLFDPVSEADRSALTGDADLAPDVGWWLFENDVPGAAGAPGSRRFATEILAAHHYSSDDDPGDAFRWSVAHAYANARTLAPNNRRRLIDYRMTDWSETSQPGGRPGFTVQSRFDPGAAPVRSELLQRWTIFGTATHESLHLRTHPGFEAADRGRGTMKEGFTEMFTIATLNTDVLPAVRAGRREALRRAVEGRASPAAPDATLLANRVTPTQYVNHRAQAERIRDGGTPPGGSAHAGVGEQAVRAAYFQGHVEYLGLDRAGAPLAGLPAPGAARALRIPPGIADVADLARRSGVPRATIERDNPGIGAPLPATAVLAGCRTHRVVAGETRALIAAQNGVSEEALAEANPDVPIDPASSAWPALAAGRVLLIPVH